MIRLFQIVGACAVMAYCLVRLVEDTHHSQSDVVYQPKHYSDKISYIERWQADALYVIYIIMCGSLVVHTLGSGRSDAPNSERGHNNI